MIHVVAAASTRPKPVNSGEGDFDVDDRTYWYEDLVDSAPGHEEY